ncbi:MAG TPA: BadF/BadG/BcrA/BcrD ATPase family protein [Acidimicrobiales bacterium]|nr:BadF/BadG/BcrA/BcrD ATPase family protein [Acidimicrobiales bacterium]
MTAVLGLDVGGTHSRARLVRDGAVVAEANGRSASLAAAGRDRAGAAVRSLLAELALGPGSGLDAVCVGAAGTGAAESDAFFVELLSPLTREGRVVVVNDARLVLAAGGLSEGIACIAGTGSIAVGVVSGRQERAGGWGYLLGDEGSGYWVVREALRELALRQDTHTPFGPLGAAVMGASRCPDMASLMQRWYDRPAPDEWAALAPLVIDCGDPFGEDIAERTALALASIISAVQVQLGGTPALPVLLAGGLLTGHQGVAGRTVRVVKSFLTGAEVRVLSDPPVAGAVRLALQAASGAAGP